jgi:hypothetical protein
MGKAKFERTGLHERGDDRTRGSRKTTLTAAMTLVLSKKYGGVKAYDQITTRRRRRRGDHDQHGARGVRDGEAALRARTARTRTTSRT